MNAMGMGETDQGDSIPIVGEIKFKTSCKWYNHKKISETIPVPNLVIDTDMIDAINPDIPVEKKKTNPYYAMLNVLGLLPDSLKHD